MTRLDLFDVAAANQAAAAVAAQAIGRAQDHAVR
jgi:hypothetical protein